MSIVPIVKSEPTPAAPVEDDGSSTESEYFDESEENEEDEPREPQGDDNDEEGEVRETNDALGGVSIQSSSRFRAPPPATAVAHIKHEPIAHTFHANNAAAAVPRDALGRAAAVSTSAPPNAMAPPVKSEPQAIKSETRAPATRQDSTAPQPTAAPPTAAPPPQSAAMTPHAPVANGHAPSPPVASSHPSAPPHPQHWHHPALAHASHTVSGYQPPPPVNYAPPRPLTQHTSVVAPAVPPATVTTSQRSAAAAPPQTSASQLLKCTTCDASLTKHHSLVPGARDCKCCGKTYPTWRFPTQNQQDRSSQRRCDSCYSAFISRRSDVAPLSSAAPQPQRATPIRVPLAPVRVLPPAPVRATAVRGAVATPTAQPRATAVRGAGTTPTATPHTTGTCATCKHATYVALRPSLASAANNLRCRCCNLTLLKDMCFSKAQRLDGKHRCKACLGHVYLGPNGEEQPTASAPAKHQTKKAKAKAKAAVDAAAANVVASLPSRTMSAAERDVAERQVAKYHLARRSLQRKRDANDLRGSTRLEYEKQLAQEDLALQALEKKLRSQYPVLFSESGGIKVIAPSLRRDEREHKARSAKSKATKAIAKKAQAAAKTAREALAARRAEAGDIDILDPTTPSAIASTPAASVVARRRAVAATGAAKRKTPPSTATASSRASAKEAPAKKRQNAAADDDNDDPWLAAQAEIAQGLSSLLGGSLDQVLAPSAAASRTTGRTTTKAPVDNSTYVPNTKLEAASPPRSTVVTRARKRTLAPVEVIDITDDSPPASPRAAKRVK